MEPANGLAGCIDAIASEGDRAQMVIDWKSDVDPDEVSSSPMRLANCPTSSASSPVSTSSISLRRRSPHTRPTDLRVDLRRIAGVKRNRLDRKNASKQVTECACKISMPPMSDGRAALAGRP